ncbi:Nkp1p [Nakaseomyces bracarensis]|uniref:Nkp1p n=1 Tax=Nakaseomyces bracarensis TaxID=273131 RepID=UPI003871F73E
MSLPFGESRTYEKIRSYIASQDATRIEDYLEDVPSEVQTLIDRQCNRKLQSLSLKGKSDHLVKTVYDLENDWKLRSLAEMMDIIGDIPRNAIGTELRYNIENQELSNTHVDNLVEDILKLPNFELVNSDESNNENESQLLREYSNIKSDVIKKCQALRYTQEKLSLLDLRLEPVNNLKAVIQANGTGTSSGNESLSEYFSNYKTELDETLKELSHTLEDALKRADDDPELANILFQELNLI